jgi:hypothetical protein
MTIISDAAQAPRLAWRRPDGSGMAVLRTAAGMAITAKTIDGTWMPMLILAPPAATVWIGPHTTARHAAQRWLEQAAATGTYPGGTEYPREPESGDGRGAEAPEVTEGSILSLPTPVARLYAAAMMTDLEVVDDDLEWLVGAGHDPTLVAAVVAFGARVLLGPGLDDDGDRADVLAMALSVSCVMVPDSDAASSGDIVAPSGFVLITRDRVPADGPAGRIANAITATCGRDTATASFGYRVMQVTE